MSAYGWCIWIEFSGKWLHSELKLKVGGAHFL